jgi:hypothetical protein
LNHPFLVGFAHNAGHLDVAGLQVHNDEDRVAHRADQRHHLHLEEVHGGDAASITTTSCPGEHHDFDCMGAILCRIASVDPAAGLPQIADIPEDIRRSNFGTERHQTTPEAQEAPAQPESRHEHREERREVAMGILVTESAR